MGIKTYGHVCEELYVFFFFPTATLTEMLTPCPLALPFPRFLMPAILLLNALNFTTFPPSNPLSFSSHQLPQLNPSPCPPSPLQPVPFRRFSSSKRFTPNAFFFFPVRFLSPWTPYLFFMLHLPQLNPRPAMFSWESELPDGTDQNPNICVTLLGPKPGSESYAAV